MRFDSYGSIATALAAVICVVSVIVIGARIAQSPQEGRSVSKTTRPPVVSSGIVTPN